MDGIERRDGHYLPHWSQSESTYFVTFRLADSLPAAIVRQMEVEYEHLLKVEENAVKRKLSVAEIERSKVKLRNKLEKYLDAGYGSCHLANRDAHP